MNWDERDTQKLDKWVRGVRGYSYTASSQPGTEDDESVSYGVSFEPLWAKYDDIVRCYTSARAKTRGRNEI